MWILNREVSLAMHSKSSRTASINVISDLRCTYISQISNLNDWAIGTKRYFSPSFLLTYIISLSHITPFSLFTCERRLSLPAAWASIFSPHLFEGFLIWGHWKVVPSVKSSIMPGREVWVCVICYLLFPSLWRESVSVSCLSLRPSLTEDHCLSNSTRNFKGCLCWLGQMRVTFNNKIDTHREEWNSSLN